MTKKMVDPAIFAGLTMNELGRKLTTALGTRTEIHTRVRVQDYQNGQILTEDEYNMVRKLNRNVVKKYPPIQTTRLQMARSGRIIETNTYKNASPMNPPNTKVTWEMIYIQDRIRVLQGLIENERQKELNRARNGKLQHGQ